MDIQEHYCENADSFPVTKFLQKGAKNGSKILILGEAPAPNGWRKSGKAFFTTEGKLLPTGRNLNQLLSYYDLSVEICGFTELIKCYPGKDRKLLSICGEKCWPILMKQIKLLDIKLIMILGVKSLEIFNKLANTQIKIGEITEIQLIGKLYKVLPIYHPSPIGPFNHKKNKEIFRHLENELKLIL